MLLLLFFFSRADKKCFTCFCYVLMSFQLQRYGFNSMSVDHVPGYSMYLEVTLTVSSCTAACAAEHVTFKEFKTQAAFVSWREKYKTTIKLKKLLMYCLKVCVHQSVVECLKFTVSYYSVCPEVWLGWVSVHNTGSTGLMWRQFKCFTWIPVTDDCWFVDELEGEWDTHWLLHPHVMSCEVWPERCGTFLFYFLQQCAQICG